MKIGGIMKIRGILFNSPLAPPKTASPSYTTSFTPAVTAESVMAQQNVAHKSLQAEVSATEKSDSNAIHLELGKNEDMALLEKAKKATEEEHKMTLWQGVKLYPKAVAWSLIISTCIAMEGYDVCLLSTFYSFDQFNRKYGKQLPDGTWQVPASWQSGLSNGVNVGEIIGLLLNGFLSERIGYRYTIILCLVSLTGFIAIFFTAPNVEVLLVAEILAGIPWGVFQTLTITYASEVSARRHPSPM